MEREKKEGKGGGKETRIKEGERKTRRWQASASVDVEFGAATAAEAAASVDRRHWGPSANIIHCHVGRSRFFFPFLFYFSAFPQLSGYMPFSFSTSIYIYTPSHIPQNQRSFPPIYILYTLA